MPRVAPAVQGIYTASIIDKTRELFGDTSVEYGMALCGALELVPAMERYIRSFAAEELLQAITVTNGDDEGAEIIDDAKWQMEIIELKELTVGHLGAAPKPAPWFRTN